MNPSKFKGICFHSCGSAAGVCPGIGGNVFDAKESDGYIIVWKSRLLGARICLCSFLYVSEKKGIQIFIMEKERIRRSSG